MLARYYKGEYETRLARIMLFRSFTFSSPFCKPGFAGEDMALLDQGRHEDGLQRGLIFFPDVKSIRRLGLGSLRHAKARVSDPVLLKAMLGDFHAEFITLFLCEFSSPSAFTSHIEKQANTSPQRFFAFQIIV